MGGHSLESFTKKYRDPLYIYDLALMQYRVKIFRRAFEKISMYFAIKANNHPKILKAFQKIGVGADVVSGGEIKRSLQCGINPKNIIFSGVGKTVQEIDCALENKLYQINVESISELKRIIDRAKILRKKASILFRYNPDVNVKTHPYIATGFRSNKFGMDSTALPELISLLKQHHKQVSLKGISLHIGSQLLELSNFEEALQKTTPLYEDLLAEGFELERFDIGGGLGIDYELQNLAKEESMVRNYAKIVEKYLLPLDCEIQAEPGRWIVGHAGVLLCQVQYNKRMPEKNFMIIDSGIHHLVRPALYKSYHRILPLREKSATHPIQKYDVVGPICESSDTIATDRAIPVLQEGEFLVIADAGAYGASMSSDYNLRTKAKEVFLP